MTKSYGGGKGFLTMEWQCGRITAEDNNYVLQGKSNKQNKAKREGQLYTFPVERQVCPR